MKTFYKVNAIIAAVGVVMLIVGGVLFSFNWKSYSMTTISYEETLESREWKDADTLKIDAGFASLNIVSGNNFKLVADEVPERFQAHLTEKNGVVTLKSDNMTYTMKDLAKGSKNNLNVRWDSAGTYTLYVPDYFENVIVDFAFGELFIDGMSTGNALIDSSFSSVKIKNFGVSEKLNIDVSFGDSDIDLLPVAFEKLTIDSSFGDFDIKNVCVTGSAYIDNSFGDLDVRLLGDDYKINNITSFGSSTVDGSHSDGNVKISVDNSFGDTCVIADESPEINFNHKEVIS